MFEKKFYVFVNVSLNFLAFTDFKMFSTFYILKNFKSLRLLASCYSYLIDEVAI